MMTNIRRPKHIWALRFADDRDHEVPTGLVPALDSDHATVNILCYPLSVCEDCYVRLNQSFAACRNIPTEALEAGVVEKMVKYIKGEPRSRCFRCCDVMPDGCPDCELGQIIKLLEESK